MNQPNIAPAANSDQEDESDFVNILDVLLESRWFIGSVTCICLILGTLYAFLAKPIYSADIMIQVEDSPDTSAAKGLLGDVSSLFDVKSSAAAEAQILGSRLVVSRAVDELKLYIAAEPSRFPIVGNWFARNSHALSDPGLWGHGGYAWGNETIAVDQFDVPKELEASKFTLTYVGDAKYVLRPPSGDGKFEGRVGQSSHFTLPEGGVNILVTQISAKPGIDFTLIRRSRFKTIDDLQTALDVKEKVKSSDVVIATLQDANPQLVVQELNTIASKYVAQNVERKAAEAAQSLSFLNVQLPQIKKKLDDAEARYTAIRNQRGTVDLTEEAKVALAQTADAKVRLLELQQRRDELSARFSPNHPVVQALNKQIGALQSYEGGYDAQIRRLPDLQQEAARLMLDVQVNTDLYTGLLNNYQQLQLVKAGKVGSVRLIDSAAIPDDPIKPKKVAVIAGATVVGLLIGIALAFLRNMLFRGVTDSAEIERHSGLNVYSTIPFSETQSRLSEKMLADRTAGLSLLAKELPNDPSVESLRSLRTALQFAMLEARNNIVLITGPAPGVGKSFVSANFAAILASGGKRILLIDGDMRKGYLNKYFGLRRTGGMSEVLAGSMTWQSAVKASVIENVDFITTGTLPPNPAELLLNGRAKMVLDEMSKNYDIVLVDSPPVLAASDTAIIAPHAGTLFLVVLSAVTRIGEITESAKRLAQVGSAVNGVLLNGMKASLGSYGYGSKYGSYRYTAYSYTDNRDN